MKFLEKVDPARATKAKQRYSCFDKCVPRCSTCHSPEFVGRHCCATLVPRSRRSMRNLPLMLSSCAKTLQSRLLGNLQTLRGASLAGTC